METGRRQMLPAAHDKRIIDFRQSFKASQADKARRASLRRKALMICLK